MRFPCFAGLVAIVGSSACQRSGGRPDGDASAGPTADGASSAGPTADGGAAAWRDWKGSYQSAESSIALAKDVTWRVPNSTAGIGTGTIALTMDTASGRLRGTLDGVLGPAILNGMAVGENMTAAVTRRDPGDHGFTGTLSGATSDAGVRGTLNVALGEASAVRSAAFVLGAGSEL